jgi:ribosome-associated translation inhibitor RaiA
MQTEPIITFRRMRRTEAVEAEIRKRLTRLERFCPSIIGARVSIGLSGRHQLHGQRYRIIIDLALSGGQIAVSHEASPPRSSRNGPPRRTRKQDEPEPMHKDLKAAMRDAFDGARRQVQDFVRRQRGM